jgi:hypothetical protein
MRARTIGFAIVLAAIAFGFGWRSGAPSAAASTVPPGRDPKLARAMGELARSARHAKLDFEALTPLATKLQHASEFERRVVASMTERADHRARRDQIARAELLKKLPNATPAQIDAFVQIHEHANDRSRVIRASFLLGTSFEEEGAYASYLEAQKDVNRAMVNEVAELFDDQAFTQITGIRFKGCDPFDKDCIVPEAGAMKVSDLERCKSDPHAAGCAVDATESIKHPSK